MQDTHPNPLTASSVDVRKYELIAITITDESLEHIAVDHTTLFRIKALIDIPTLGVKEGDLGGFVQSELSVSHQGNCWIADNSFIEACSTITGNALVKDNSTIYQKSTISGDAIIQRQSGINSSRIANNAIISNSAIENNSNIEHQTKIINSEVNQCMISGSTVLRGSTACGVFIFDNSEYVNLRLDNVEEIEL